MINTRKLSFFIVGISIFLPLVAAFFDNKLFVILPLLSMTLIFIYFIYKINGNINIPLVLILPLLVAIASLMVSFIVGSISHLGFINVMAQALLLYLMMQQDKKFNIQGLYKFLMYTYALIIFLSLIDWIFILSRNQDILVSMFNSENVVKYKNYNSATLLQFITGNGGFTAANGPTLGSQGLSQLLTCGLIFFNPLLNYKTKTIFMILLIMYLFSATMTTTIFISILMLLILLKNNINNINIEKLLILVIILYFSDDLIGLVFFRLNKIEDLQEYYDAYFKYSELAEIEYINILFGQDIGNIYSGSDFGFLSIILSGGLIYFLAFFILQCYIFMIGIKCFKFRASSVAKKNKELLNWANLGATSAIVTIMFFWGLIHYTASIELGGAQLYSLCIALTIFAYSKIDNVRY
jgi:hypothetical protein